MQSDIDERVEELIQRFHLHTNGIPVNLTGLEVIFPVKRRDLHLSGVTGFTSNRADGTSVIVISTELGDIDSRLAYAHEIGHILHGHSGTLRVMQIDEWFHNHQERDAWKVAAELLIPVEEVAKHHEWSAASIATLCEVPEWLVRLHLGM